MSVEFVEGNLLDFPAGITTIAHCANCQNTFGSGIAKQIKDRYPEAYVADTEAHEEVKKQGTALLGLFSTAQTSDGKKITNLYGQERYGKDRRHLDYEGFYVALKGLRDALENAHKAGRTYILGLPFKIGCDRAGGDWMVVYAMILSLFDKSPVRCVLVMLPKSEASKVTLEANVTPVISNPLILPNIDEPKNNQETASPNASSTSESHA